MRGDVMADGTAKRIDLAALLLSVRRCGGADAASALPFYKPELKPGPVSHPGAVPFVSEHRPGEPKRPAPRGGSSVRTRRARPLAALSPEVGTEQKIEMIHSRDEVPEVETKHSPQDSETKRLHATTTGSEEAVVAVAQRKEADHAEEEEEEARFSDALDTLSRVESFTMNSGVSVLSGAPDAAAAEPHARGFMMDRFLPAAQAVAINSPQYTFRKAAPAGVASTRGPTRPPANARVPVQLLRQHLTLNYVPYSHSKHGENDDDGGGGGGDDEYDTQSTRGFASKGCGLLPGLCMKGSFLLLNPVPVMKRRGGGGGGMGRGQGRVSPAKDSGQKPASRLARSSLNVHLGHDPSVVHQSWEEVYKHRLEQRYLGQWEHERSKPTSESNRLTYCSDSQAGGRSWRFHCSTGGGASPYHGNAVVRPSNRANGSAVKGDHGDRSGGGSLVGWDCGGLKGSGSMSSGLDSNRTVHEHSKDRKHNASLGRGRQAVKATDTAKGKDDRSSTWLLSEVRGLADGERFSQDFALHFEGNIVAKKEVVPLQALLPLPVPRSPSESWLSRTLPSVSKKPPLPSFLGIQVQSMKQAPGAKPSSPRQIRFADVIERPNSLDSEI